MLPFLSHFDGSNGKLNQLLHQPAPGLVATDMAGNELETNACAEKMKNIPVGRIATLSEVAEVAAFLACDAASYISGQIIKVNGGVSF